MCCRTRRQRRDLRDIARSLNGVGLGSTAITQVRDAIYLVNVIARALMTSGLDRNASEPATARTQCPGIALAAVATFRYELEQPVVWRRSRVPTITISRHP